MGVDKAGFSENTNIPTYKVEDERNKLTIEEMNAYVYKHPRCGFSTDPSSYDMHEDIREQFAKRRGQVLDSKFIKGLPVGLHLPNGVVIGQA